MTWNKKGLLFNVQEHISENIKSHASIPYSVHLEHDIFRFFFSSRNQSGKSYPYYIDAEVKNGNIILVGKASKPLMKLGVLGTFDDSGIMPSCLVEFDDKLYMYYIGWNPQVTVSYRLSIGLAISIDRGNTFERVSNGPVCDRSIDEPFFNTAPFVLIDDDTWKMWYISCTKWQVINDYPEPSYHVKYAESDDGILWQRKGIVCIDYDETAKAIGRPCVIKSQSEYEMFFSYRDIEGYRSIKEKGYRIGKAVSSDGIKWEKKYKETGIELSDSGWDSNMMEYCHVFDHKDISYMLYNGNNFGKEGFGYASK